MDEFFLQLAELNRAGWAFQIDPESNGPTLPATRAAIIWTLRKEQIGAVVYGLAIYPQIDWINLFAPEIELRKAVAKMHAWVFPTPPYGDIAA